MLLFGAEVFGTTDEMAQLAKSITLKLKTELCKIKQGFCLGNTKLETETTEFCKK